jgi:hypothetical protein
MGVEYVQLGWQGAVTIVVLGIGLILMAGDWLAPHLTFTLMVGILMTARVITTRDGASGFSNTGVLTVSLAVHWHSVLPYLYPLQ